MSEYSLFHALKMVKWDYRAIREKWVSKANAVEMVWMVKMVWMEKMEKMERMEKMEKMEKMERMEKMEKMERMDGKGPRAATRDR